MTGDQLKSHLLSIRKNDISRQELVLLIQFSRLLAQKYLLYHRPSVLRLCENAGISESDLGVDITADIFTKDHDDRFFELGNFMRSFDPPFENADDTHVYFAFKKFVLQKASSRLAKTYAQADPSGARILRNVKDQVKKIPTLEIVEDFRGKVLQMKSDHLDSNQPEFPLDVLEQELLSRVDHTNRVPDILVLLPSIFTERPQFRRSVPLFDFVQIIRRFYVDNDEEEVIAFDKELTVEEIEVMETEVMVFLNKIIFTKYYPRKISTKGDAEKLVAALKDVISGFWQSTEDKNSVEKSVRKHFALTHEEYKQQWKNQAEYLVKLAKEQFSALLDGVI